MSGKTVADRPHSLSVGFVLATSGLDAIGIGIIVPIVPGWVQEPEHLPLEQVAP